MQPMTPFVPKNILLMPNAAVPKASLLADRISACLKTHNVNHNIFCYDYENPTQLPHIEGHDLIIVIGGDGTLLRAGHFCAPLDIPLLGVQAGRLSFLVELNEIDIESNLKRLLSADYRLERRMMLQAEFLENGNVIQRWDVINEALISRGRDARPIEVRVDLNEGYMMSYIADGLIVATATGSTAYALASGGPILPPELRNMLVVPIAPHLSLDRAVVLAEGAVVNLRAIGDFEVVLSVDGTTPITIGPENSIRVTANKKSLLMARFGEPNYFYRDLAGILQRNPILEIKTND
ncbi:MAG TPA: NAD(+)/NADH kinase [Anaerolineaceae bacterium]|nr:NAD(+)/NADH kinase [Anaerolineaceae bacterium]